MSIVLLTGGTGFLGRHVAATLIDRGLHVHAIVRREDPDLAALGVRQFVGDLLSGDALAEAAVGATFAVHCAGKVSRKKSDAEELQRLHVDGTARVLDACEAAGVSKVVVASTSGVVAVSEDPDAVAVEDDATPMAILACFPYYRSKYFAETRALGRNRDGFSVVSVNPTLLLGPGDVHGSSTEDVRLFLERKIPFAPWGGLSFVDARDAAEGIVLALERGRGGARYLLGAQNITFAAFFERLGRISDRTAPLLPLPRLPSTLFTEAEKLEKTLDRWGIKFPVDPGSLELGQYTWYLDASRAENELGWSPRDPMETLRATVNDLYERGVVWPDA